VPIVSVDNDANALADTVPAATRDPLALQEIEPVPELQISEGEEPSVTCPATFTESARPSFENPKIQSVRNAADNKTFDPASLGTWPSGAWVYGDSFAGVKLTGGFDGVIPKIDEN